MILSKTILIICFFTAFMHFSECIGYCLRLAGIRTKQIAIAISFVASTLLISRLSNMFQAPLLGAVLDATIIEGSPGAFHILELQFRSIIFAAFLGTLCGAFLLPSMANLFEKAVTRFKVVGSLPMVIIEGFRPRNLKKIPSVFRWPKFSDFRRMRLGTLPKSFLILNLVVTSMWTIGVLCSLLAGAYVPEFRATAINLSGIVNGIGTIVLTLFVDPGAARVTDEVAHNQRPYQDAVSTVFFLTAGKLLGTLILAQLFLTPLTRYIVYFTEFIVRFFT